LIAGLAAAPLLTAAARTPDVARLHERLLVVDSHVDIPPNLATPVVNPSRANSGRQFTLDGMVRGGVDAAFFIVYIGQADRNAAAYKAAYEAAIRKFAAIRRLTEVYANRIGLAGSAAEVEALRAQGKRAALIGVENGYPIGRDLANIGRFQALGARYMTLVHNGHNDIGDSAQPNAALGDKPVEHSGLSDFGAQVVAELNRTGILVDVSHAAKSTMMEATRRSRAPVVASHSGVRALVNHPRNMDDEQLKALKARGGVIQITAVDEFMKQAQPARDEAIKKLGLDLGVPELIDDEEPLTFLPAALQARYQAGLRDIDARWPGASITDLVNHIDYAVKLIGDDHVGIASDFGGGGGVAGWREMADTPAVTRALLARGYSEESLRKIWGGNLMRILTEARA
jgi:membrane dipeptidase